MFGSGLPGNLDDTTVARRRRMERQMAHTRAMAKVVRFFRVGYPAGFPRTGYLPALALLRRRLSDEDVLVVAKVITDAGKPISNGCIRRALARHFGEPPPPEHVDRMTRELSDTGWLTSDTEVIAKGQPLPKQQAELHDYFVPWWRQEGRTEPDT